MALTAEEKQKWLDVLKQTGGNREVMLKQRALPESYLAWQKQCTQTEQILTFDGLSPVRVIVTVPQNKGENAPLHVNYHGGGFIMKQNEDDDRYCAHIACATGAVVVDVDYASSKDDPYPMALNQSYEVTKWAIAHCAAWGCDEKRVSIGGSSAGGDLAMAIALKNNETKDFALCLVALEYAANDNYMPMEDEALLRSQAFSMLYADGDVALLKDPMVSPCFVTDDRLRGLPPMLVLGPKLCPFYEQNLDLGMRMVQQGVEVTFHSFPNSHHGFLVRIVDEWQEAQEVMIRAIRRAGL